MVIRNEPDLKLNEAVYCMPSFLHLRAGRPAERRATHRNVQEDCSPISLLQFSCMIGLKNI